MVEDEGGDSGGIFPDQIIFEILTRLPATTTTRFKTVSKTWYSLLSTPHFISSYLSRSPLSWVIFDRFIRVNSDPSNEFTLQWQNPPNVSILSLNPHKLAVDSSVFQLESRFPATLVKSSNGLILISIKIRRDPLKPINGKVYPWMNTEDGLYLVNPTTREWVSVLNPPTVIAKQCALGFITRVGKDRVLEKFLIVEYKPSEEFLMCYSSKTGKWEVISVDYMLGRHEWRGDEAFEFDGHLVWVDLSVGIITWDDPFGGLGAIRCRFVELPRQCLWADCGASLDEERCIDVSGGCIQFLEVSKDKKSGVSLWRLKDYESGEWSLVYKVSFKSIWLDGCYVACGLKKVVPIVCLMHPFDVDVGYYRVGNRVFSLNVRTGKLESCANGYTSLGKYFYFAAVQLPSWPTSFSRSLKATFQKELGNDYFKAKKYKEAIKCYSRSIALSPNAFGYGNRALAYLKIGSYHEAEVDCTESLKLDCEYIKAYGRRAIARKELGDFKGSIEDVELALKLDPNSQEMKKLHAELKKNQENGFEVEFAHEGTA